MLTRVWFKYTISLLRWLQGTFGCLTGFWHIIRTLIFIGIYRHVTKSWLCYYKRSTDWFWLLWYYYLWLRLLLLDYYFFTFTIIVRCSKKCIWNYFAWYWMLTPLLLVLYFSIQNAILFLSYLHMILFIFTFLSINKGQFHVLFTLWGTIFTRDIVFLKTGLSWTSNCSPSHWSAWVPIWTPWPACKTFYQLKLVKDTVWILFKLWLTLWVRSFRQR